MADTSEHAKLQLPKEPIDAVVEPLKRFLHIESASGIVLLLATAIALILANSGFSETYLAFWKTKVGFSFGNFEMMYSLQHWINDFLMAIFFFVIGLEVKRELVIGELNDIRKASLPLAAAVGGMVVPAAVYLALQSGLPGARGWGIPMATDIAFVVGCLAVMGSRIPNGLRILLLSLAIADDIGAILVIAIGYTDSLNMVALFGGFGFIALFVVLLRLGVQNVSVYGFVALLIWFGFHESGVHATIAGVIVGLLTPTRPWISENRLSRMTASMLGFLRGEGWLSKHHRYETIRTMERAARKTVSPLERFETDLHPWVGFFIMPVFALANAGVTISPSSFTDSVAIAVMLGLLVGKPTGILLFSLLAVKLKIASLPDGVGWGAVTGGGLLAGIGFTMAIFISGLALHGDMQDAAKVGILAGSALAAVIGVGILLIQLPRVQQHESGT